MKFRQICRIVITLAVLTMAVTARAQQSDNHVLVAVPAPGKVAIDGDLSDWDTSGKIVVCRDVANVLGKFSAEVSLMYDSEALYAAIDWADPTPMVNNYDPQFDVDLRYCFHADSVQFHFHTDQERKVIGWNYARDGSAKVRVFDGWFPWSAKPLLSTDGIRDLGITEAFKLKANGTGYIQELRIPWKAIVKSGRPYRPGEEFECMLDLVWGPDSGRGWPVMHMMDLVKPGAVHTGWFWEVKPMYGKIRLSPDGKLRLPEPDFLAKGREAQPRLQKTEGPIALTYTMPFDGFATLVVEDANGRRVKNVIGMAPRSQGAQTDYWDGTDERGQLAPPGDYRYRGLVHRGIQPVYEATYGTPGVPPWDTGDGTGAWMSDHSPPRAVAAGGQMLVLGADHAESGYSIIGTDLEGHKKWGDAGLVGIRALAADEQYAYAALSGWNVKEPVIARLELKTGKYAPFATPAGEQWKVPIFKDGEKREGIVGITVGPERLAVAVGGKLVRFFDKKTAAILGEFPVPDLRAVLYDEAGTLYVWAQKKLWRVSGDQLKPVIDDPDQKTPSALAVDASGSFYLADDETNQVRVYGKDGKFLRAIGLPSGRPARGQWQPKGMLSPSGVAIDATGKLWVTEMNSTPKRVSVWDPKDGKLIKDFIGPTGYGGTGANADPDDKTRVFGSGCEFKLDYATNQATVVAALGDVGGEILKAEGREYIMSKSGSLYLRQGDNLKRVAAIGNPRVKNLKETRDIPLPPAPPRTHDYSSESFVWSDLNDDGTAQPEEVAVGSRWAGWNRFKYPVGTSGYFGSYWLNANFDIVTTASESFGGSSSRGPFLTRIPRTGWTKGGAPIWDLANQKLLSEDEALRGAYYVTAGGVSVGGNPITGIGDDGTLLWTYADRWPGVHASHDAPLPERDDVLVGTLGCIGTVKTPVGTVFGLHSNMGRLYLMSADGLFVASVFRDVRLGSDAWPSEARPGAPLGGVTMGSEWFGGHLFQSTKTGESYLIAGFTAYNLIKLNGLDQIQPLSPQTLKVTPKQVQLAEKRQQERAAKTAPENLLRLAKMPPDKATEGKLSINSFPKDSFVKWAAGPYKIRSAIAVDAQNLYIAFEVSGDANPMVNRGKDVNQLFATGDSVNLELATDAAADPRRRQAAQGDVRLLLSVFNDKPVAVLYRWITGGEKSPVTFSSPWRSHTVDRVEVLPDARVKITRGTGNYTVVAAVPLKALGFKPEPGKQYQLDLGAIFSDAKGDNRAARVYWANKATGLVSDVPGEIMAAPNLWGKASLAP